MNGYTSSTIPTMPGRQEQEYRSDPEIDEEGEGVIRGAMLGLLIIYAPIAWVWGIVYFALT